MNLLDLMEAGEPKPKQADCRHPRDRQEKTNTDWGSPYGVRMTWTCRDCGYVTGRVDNR
jgi:rubrerythrin